jgi:hypothetical protein
MKKCLLFIRTSTNRQEVQSQIDETKEYAKSLGYNEFVILDKRGASAYKVADEYLALLEEMKSTIENDPSIKSVVCWAMNRLFRNIKVADELKDWFVEHKVQLEIREPHIKLLEDDGTLSDASEMLFHFFAVYNKQQINELRAKSHRAKVRDKALHKFIGGRKKFGYKVINKQVVPDEAEVPIVNAIFDLYASGVSYHKTTNEINERYGMSLNWDRIKKMICDTSYFDGKQYPPIITQEQFDACVQKRDKNWSKFKPMESKHYRFANRLIRCSVCGKGYTANVESYKCIDSDGSRMVAINNMDGILWAIASHLESERLVNENSKDEYLKKIAVLEQKIASVDKCTSKGQKRADRAKKMALEGLIEVEEYKAILEAVKKEQEEVDKKVRGWRAAIAELENLIKEDKLSIQRVLSVADHIEESDELQMRDIVRKWVKKITIGDDDVFVIETLVRVYKCKYLRYNWRSRWYTVNGNPLMVRPVIRKNGECKLGELHNKPEDIVYMAAWLEGSEIV